MKLLASSLLAVAVACAQNAAQLEIRGTVVEGTLGIGGVTVTLYEFGHTPAEATTRSVFATAFTDATGAFVFHPVRTGEYYVEVNGGLLRRDLPRSDDGPCRQHRGSGEHRPESSRPGTEVLVHAAGRVARSHRR